MVISKGDHDTVPGLKPPNSHPNQMSLVSTGFAKTMFLFKMHGSDYHKAKKKNCLVALHSFLQRGSVGRVFFPSHPPESTRLSTKRRPHKHITFIIF